MADLPAPETSFTNRALWLGLAACILISGTFASCARPSSDPTTASSDEEKGRRLPARIVPDAEIQKFAAKAPERQLLTWAQALQFNDADAVKEFMSPAALRAVGSGQQFVDAVEKASETMPRIGVVNIRPQRGRATIRATETTYNDLTGKLRTLKLVSYRMVKVGNRWKVDDPSLLVDATRASTADDR